MVKHFTEAEKIKMVSNYEANMSKQDIMIKCPISKLNLNKVLKRYANTSNIKRKKGSGRPKAFNDFQIDLMKKKIEKFPKIVSIKITEEINSEFNTNYSARTIRNYLKTVDLSAFRPLKKPLLSSKNIFSTFQYSKEHLWNSEAYWKKVLWPDDTKINLFGSDGMVYLRRPRGFRGKENFMTPTVKHGKGSIMVWGCFSYEGVGRIEIIKGNMIALYYTKILNRNLFKSVDELSISDNYIFQQDNDPKHKAALTNEFFDKNNVEVLNWPSQSSDMNPIENLWHYLKIQVHKRKPKNLKELEEFVVDEWFKIPQEMCKNLVNSVPKRIEQLYKSKGRSTLY
ncbi:TCB1 [Hepatospora eriocheir]|uniref:TCB1 n=1 Tax=Hepatospora eriocheir TaxID=1081669 RepID=A0A1X0QG37_9MICR|nr:TCB1 [Hepatospora eriocheir]